MNTWIERASAYCSAQPPVNGRIGRSHLRYLILAGWAMPWFVFAFVRSHQGLTDWDYFIFGGRALLGTMPGYHAGPLHLYASHPELQIGPLALLIAAPLTLLPGDGSALAGGLLMLLAGLGAIWCLDNFAPGRRLWHLRATTMGAALLLPFWSYSAGSSIHIDDAAALVAAVAGLLVLTRGRRWLLAAVLLGLAVSFKPWAVIFAPLITLLPQREWLRSGMVLCGTSLLPWLPFIIGDPHTVASIGSYTVPVDPRSVLHLVGFHRAASPHWLRPAQFYLGAAAAVFCVRAGRWPYAILAALSVRIALDPQVLFYYGIGPLLGALLLDHVRKGPWPVWTTAIVVFQYGGPMVFPIAAPWLRIGWIASLWLALIRSPSLGLGGEVAPIVVPSADELPPIESDY